MNEVFEAGAQAQVGRIDGDFARAHFRGMPAQPTFGVGDEEETDFAAEIEDLLA